MDELKLTKAHHDLETKSKALDTELEKVKVNEVSIQTSFDKNKVLNVKQEEIEANIKEKQKGIPCEYLHRLKGCRRGKKCWSYHDESQKADKKSIKIKAKPN